MEENDIALRDYHYAFRGTTDDWHVPESQYREYLILEKQSKQNVVTQDVSGTGMTIAVDDNNNVTVQRGPEILHCTLDEFMRFVTPATSILESMASQRSAPTAGQFKGDQAMKVDTWSPELKRNHDKALAEIEKFARASYGHYPKHR